MNPVHIGSPNGALQYAAALAVRLQPYEHSYDMTISGIILCCLLLGEVTVHRIDSTQVTGRLKSVDAQQFVIDDGNTVTKVPADSIADLTRTNPGSSTFVTTQVGLTDGSELRVRSVELNAKTLALQLAGPADRDATLNVPLEHVLWIRMRAPIVDRINQQWQTKIDADRSADKLVVRATDVQLDEVSGTVLTINGDSVAFDLDGQSIDAPLERLEGIVFRASARETAAPLATVTDMGGSRWAAMKIDGKGRQLEIETGLGWKRAIAIDQIRQVDFGGNMQMIHVADLTDIKYRTYIGGLLDSAAAASMFGIRDTDQGLMMSAGSEFSIRVEKPFGLFETNIERPAHATLNNHMKLVIELDGKEAFNKTLAPEDLPLPIQIKVAGSKRMHIALSAADDTASGDVLLLRKPHLRK